MKTNVSEALHPIQVMEDLNKAACPLKLAFGTCVIFVTTPYEVYVAADTQRIERDVEDEASEFKPAFVCKIFKLGEMIHAASSGLSYFEGDTKFDTRELIKKSCDPSKSIGENVQLIEDGLYDRYLETTKYIAERRTEQFAIFQNNPPHIALFGFENDSPVISAIKFEPHGPDHPAIQVRKVFNVGIDPLDPTYVLGCNHLVIAARIGFELPEIQSGIVPWLWLEKAMNWCVQRQPEPKTIGGEIAILKLESGEKETWIRRPAVCEEAGREELS